MPPKAKAKAAIAAPAPTAAQLRRLADQIDVGLRDGYPRLPVLQKWEAAQAAEAAGRTYVDRKPLRSPCCGPRRNVPLWPPLRPLHVKAIKALLDEISYERDIAIQERALIRGHERIRRRAAAAAPG